SMREHQKYFPVVDDSGSLMAGFVAVNNTRVHHGEITRKGHERVLRARLEDALFFFNSDRQIPLAERISGLEGIIFQDRLGTMLEKQVRLIKLARLLAEKIDPRLVDDCCRSAELCKADLLTDMVGEFPSLQGVMGAAYAEGDGENAAVVQGIREHYMPKRAGAEIPASDVGAIVGLADRIDTLAGCFGIGQIPSGSADPFALRRLSLAILHIIEGRGYQLSLTEIVAKALSLYGDKVDGSAAVVEKILTFIRERFINDAVRRGENPQAVEAAAAVGFDDVVDCRQRMAALAAIQREEAFTVLSTSYKRIKNIAGENHETSVDTALFAEPQEQALYTLYGEVAKEMDALVAAKEYSAALKVMLKLKAPVDDFFDAVMVMAEDPAIRRNRLNLL
ncbi:MAG: glycine--tRNA ligase subunit beta, partial [Desulfobacterales bacterium]